MLKTNFLASPNTSAKKEKMIKTQKRYFLKLHADYRGRKPKVRTKYVLTTRAFGLKKLGLQIQVHCFFTKKKLFNSKKAAMIAFDKQHIW